MAVVTGDYVGSKVRITTKTGICEGFLSSVDMINKRMTLEKVVFAKTGKRVSGLHHFFQYEIESVEMIEDRRKKVKDVDGPFLITKKRTNPHLAKVKDLKRDMYLAEKATTDKTEKRPNVEDIGPPLVRYKNFEEALEKTTPDKLALQKWSHHYIVIEKCDKVYRAAIAHIQEQTVIGLAMEGLRMGRNGDISLIQVATRSHVIIFDVLKMGRELFSEGLGGILEYSNIQKIIHDSRYKSDALFHLYGIKLVNVFDTQVAEVMIYRNLHDKDTPRYVQSLSTLLVQYLEFDSNHAFFYRMREGADKTDQKAWMQRPMHSSVLEIAMRNVMYLPHLRIVTLEKMLQDFTDGVDIFLSTVRDASEETRSEHEQKSHLLPTAFNSRLSNQKFTNLYKQRYQNQNEGSHLVDQHGRRENCIGPLDTNVIFSNDSIWHEGNGTGFQPDTLGKTLQECHRVGRICQTTKAYIVDDDDSGPCPVPEDESLLAYGLARTTKKTPKPHIEEKFMSVKSIPAGASSKDIEDKLISKDMRLRELDIKDEDYIIVNNESTQPQSTQAPTANQKTSGNVNAHGVNKDKDSSDAESPLKMTGVSPGAPQKRASPGGLGRSRMLQSFLQCDSIRKGQITGKSDRHSADERFSDSADDTTDTSPYSLSRGEKIPEGTGSDIQAPTVPPALSPKYLGYGRGCFTAGRGLLKQE